MTELPDAMYAESPAGLAVVIAGLPAVRLSESAEAPLGSGVTLGSVAKVLSTLNALSRRIAAAYLLKSRMSIYGASSLHLEGAAVAEREVGDDDAMSGYLREQLRIGVPRDSAPLLVMHMSMHSPLTIEAIATTVLGTGGVTAIVYFFKNPEKLGKWWPKVQTSWYDGRAEAVKAERAYRALKDARTEMHEIGTDSVELRDLDVAMRDQRPGPLSD
ncbi:hypothetical protein GT755_35740 [Herbidospora sp. NEAU-GS84]|uniref:Uncharacterized protein n=1 Tax=Herbidospora solisilvae TaxID=2696284 RepID=A0A7C9N5N8_9ACTN|nr:hypothetical protein [Herbidospora solisilvae]NAS27010.1 hypothetical protein [Herbidospora solisilvae]